MAQKSVFKVTAIEIKSPQGSTLLKRSDTAKPIAFVAWGSSILAMEDGTEDTLLITSDGWQIVFQESFSDFVTALSGTDITGS